MAFANDYISVADRVQEFYLSYPQGSIQCEIVHRDDALVIVRASVYRTADDLRPSVAHSQLAIPGKTNFTKGSELENAETSAVGRAIAFFGFAAKGIATDDEVRGRQNEPPPQRQEQRQAEPPAEPTAQPSEDARLLRTWLNESGWKFGDEHVRMVLSLSGPITVEGVNAALDAWFMGHPGTREQQRAGLSKQISDMHASLNRAPVGVA